ncbi:Lrp/AsnC family transcriptional regulator [Candidatus Micrarchaeota archaeon]|nr:Lrp/AsnC family transcriptional regulator [Candidatus Micrarchaeota archaeon]MBU1886872.1 Lrp/AsnC family transcriptional regulator [Candidatus Micrarchaeota archaeon]
MEEKTDQLDRRILLELDRNSRQSFSQLAKKLKTSKSVVTYRIKQLEDKKIIKGYYTVIDTSKLGYYNFRVYIKLRETSKKQKEEIIDYLVASKNTWWVATTIFPYDIASIFIAKNLHEFNHIFKEFLRKFKKNMHEYDVEIYVDIKHFFRDYLVFDELIENRKFITMGEEEKLDLNKQELDVLREVSLNSRTGTVKLAKKLKMSPITAKNIIKRLQKLGVIQGFRILFDYSRLDYEYYWIHIDVTGIEKEEKLKQFVRMFPETVYLAETVGGMDVEFGVQVKREKGIQKILVDIFDRFDNVITDYKYFKVLENKKVIYMPQE